MKRHPTDIVALLFGLAFAIAGASFIVYETTDRTVDPAWVTGGGLILLGAIALAMTLARAVRPSAPSGAVESEDPDPVE
jgi:hypothetical protein